MKVNNNYSKLNFTGYKNLLVNNVKDDNGFQFAFLAMQLDNNGNNDLDTWKTLQRTLNEADHSDVISFMYTKMPEHPGLFLLGNRRLFSGEELAVLRRRNLGTRFENHYLEEENAHLKAYTFIANLTRRIMSQGLFDKNAEFRKVIITFYETLTNILGDEKRAFEIINTSALQNKEPQKTALTLNKYIDRTMMKFFK